jgi:hypothetical protein
MSKTGELIFLNVWIIFWITICIGHIWGNLAEKSYNFRMKWCKWLMRGKWADKEYFIKSTKRIFYFSLPFGIIFYFLILFSILHSK